MTAEERRCAGELLEQLTAAATGGTASERLGLLARMLLVYPITGDTAAAGKARGEAYLDAIGDIAPWAINEAIRRWHRGEGGLDERGQPYNYTFSPAPAVLLRICRSVIEPYSVAMAKMRHLLDAVSLERAMDSTPLDQEAPVTALRRAK